WYDEASNDFWLGAIFLTTYYLTFNVQALFADKDNDQYLASIVATLNSLAFFILFSLLITDFYPDYHGLFTWLLAVTSFLIYLIAKAIKKENLRLTYLGLSILFLTITIPIEFNGEWVTILWATEALILALVGIKVKVPIVRKAAYVIAAIVAIKTFFVDFELLDFSFSNFWSSRLFVYSFVSASFYVAAYYLKKSSSLLEYTERTISPLYSWASAILLTQLLFLEINFDWISVALVLFAIVLLVVGLFFRSVALRIQSSVLVAIVAIKTFFVDYELSKFSFDDFWDSTRIFVYLSVIVSIYLMAFLLKKNFKSVDDNENYIAKIYTWVPTVLFTQLLYLEFQSFWISVSWAVFALLITAFGFGLNSKIFRLQGILLFGLTILKVFLYDSSELTPIYRTVSFMVLGVILLLVSFGYNKYKDRFKEMF
ncbi:MAG: DUF2339 domain-containing protein, partial [bacterium]|nr:DUF2339 domain-containing protein [bacterium]